MRTSRFIHNWTRRCRRWWRYEFWPAWWFYLPVVPWFVWLAVRYRGFTVWTAANPGIPTGGLIGESKFMIQMKLDTRWAQPSYLIPPASADERSAAVQAQPFAYPIIAKPDASQRGASVRKILHAEMLERYLVEHPGAVLLQPYHPGPFEIGVFYVRLPGETVGSIFSITDKVFPVVMGDGRSTLAERILEHPRYRLQKDVFFARHAQRLNDVLADGEAFPLVLAGNHCQGTMFRDGQHLSSESLRQALDECVQSFDGFHFGRFDIRYTDEASLRERAEFAIIELNGVTAESTNIYDPEWSIFRAYRTLYRQWALAFRIGAMNRARGHRPLNSWQVLKQIVRYYRERQVNPLSD